MIEFADAVHLYGVVERIRVPFLVAHGADDRQIPLEPHVSAFIADWVAGTLNGPPLND